MVQPAPSTIAGVVPCMIVPEVLKQDNYERWCIFMQHYLVAQDLWDVVLSSEMSLGEDPRDWIKKNALALHAIKISCHAEIFDRIKEMNSAKEAWDALAHKPPNEDGNKDTGIKNVERKQAVTLLKDIKKGDSEAVMKLFQTHPHSARALENGSTALHVAITAGKIELAKELISVMSKDELEIQDKSGRTALSLAACKGSTKMVEFLVEKNKKLLEIPDCEKKIPLVLACATHHKSLTLYLYSVTPTEFLDPKNGDHGFYLLKECIRNHMFDIGLDLLHKFSDLTFHKSSQEPTPIISVLIQILSVFSANKPRFWERHKYSCIQIPIIKDLLDGDKWKTLPKPGQPRLYDLKYAQVYAREMLRFICEQVSTLDREQLLRSGAVEATFKAIKLGFLDFVKQITEANPDIVWSLDPKHSRDMLMYAVAYRQEKIAKFLYGLDAFAKNNDQNNITAFTIDKDQNNMLHLAAKLAPVSCTRSHISDPVLHMQNEANWFKEVRGVVPQFYKEQRNKDGETPSEVFSREHQGLLKEAQTWVKATANFSAIIGTLIIGIMFAATITVPGGSNQETGFPIFSKTGYFLVFIYSDAFSVLFASVSVLLFLHLHKSSLTEEDFLTGYLTKKLIMSFYSLSLSIGTMLLSSSASFSLMTGELNKTRALRSISDPFGELGNFISGLFYFAVFCSPSVIFFIKEIRPIFKISKFIFRKRKQIRPVYRFSF